MSNEKTIADIVMGRIKPALESQLNAFQRDMVGWQGKIAVTWNTVNVFIRVLHKKGLVTEEDFREAGEELMKEAQRNVAMVKAKADIGERAGPGDLIQTPMDDAQRVLGEIKDNAQEVNDETVKEEQKH